MYYVTFRARQSCESELLLTIDDFACALNNRLQVDAGILDFSKAFDRVPHARLMKKLEFYGIQGEPLQWITSFLNSGVTRLLLMPGQRAGKPPTYAALIHMSIFIWTSVFFFKMLFNAVHDCIKGQWIKIPTAKHRCIHTYIHSYCTFVHSDCFQNMLY